MAHPTFIAINQTGSDIVLKQLRVTLPASSSIVLSESNDAWKIQSDEQLHDLIGSGSVLINDGTMTLTLSQSLNYVTTHAAKNDLSNVEAYADVTDWTNVSTALGGQAGANSGWVFKSSGTGSGSMGKNTQNIPNRFTVSTTGDCDFTSIADAISAAIAAGADATTPYVIQVYPGTYTEPAMTMQMGISVIASVANRLDTVYIEASDSNSDLFTFTTGGSISGVSCSNVLDPSRAIVRISTPNTLVVMHGLSVYNCSNGVIIEDGAKAVLTNFSVNITNVNQGITGNAIQCTGTGSYVGLVNAFFSAPVGLLPFYATNPVQTCVSVNDNAEAYIVTMTARVAYKDSTADVIFADGGSSTTVFSSEVAYSNNAIHIGAGGSNTRVFDQGCSLKNNVLNRYIESSTGLNSTNSIVDASPNSLVTGAKLVGYLTDTTDNVSKLIGETKYTFISSSYDVDLGDWFADMTSTGVSAGGYVTSGSGLNVNIEAGDGWIVRGDPYHDSRWVAWSSGSLALANNATNYVYYSNLSSSITSSVSAGGYDDILLSVAITSGSNVFFLHDKRLFVDNIPKRLTDYLVSTRKLAINTGIVTSVGTTSSSISVDAGSYYFGLNLNTINGSSGDATFLYAYNGGNNYFTGSTTLDINRYDLNGVLTPLASGTYKTDTVYVTSDNKVIVMYGTTQYLSSTLAASAPRVTAPSYIDYTAFPTGNAVILSGSGITTVVDIRLTPTAGTSGAGTSGTSVHSLLSGLSADDHTQYLLIDGTRNMGGSLNMGGNNITNVGVVDGVDVSAHAARHNPGGTDALATGAPVAVLVGSAVSSGSASSYALSDHQHGITSAAPQTLGSANVEGNASSVARSDHVHAHGNLSGSTMHAVAVASGSAGFLSGLDKAKLDTITDFAAPLTSAAPVDVTKSTAVVGVSTHAARADHKHNISTAAPISGLGSGSLEGTATSLARSDHTHDHSGVLHLIHFIDNGPAEGFTTGAFKEILPVNSPFPLTMTWWTSSGKTIKIVEKTITRGSNQFPTTVMWKMYNSSNVVLATVTDTYDYSGGLLTPTVTRTIA